MSSISRSFAVGAGNPSKLSNSQRRLASSGSISFASRREVAPSLQPNSQTSPGTRSARCR